MKNVRALGVLATAVLVSTCGEPVSPPRPPEPEPGVLSVRLTTPNADDAALIVRITGPTAMTSVVAGNPAHEIYSRAEAKAFNAALFGDLAGGVLLRFHVPDIAKVAEYSATVVEVADQANALRESLAGYVVTVER